MKPLRLLALLSVLLSAVWALYPQAVRSQGLVFRGRQAEYYRGQPAVAGEVLVHLIPGASLASLRAAVDAEEDRPIGTQGWRRVRSRSRRIDTLLAVLATRGDVIEVEPNYIVEATAIPNDPIFPWGLKSTGGGINAQSAWDLTIGSAATVVGVIDTGVEYTHPDLAANMWTAPADFTISVSGVPVTCSAGTHGFNAITGTCNPADDNGHGTHTSGTIGAVGNNGIGAVGVNWTTRIMALKFLDAGGRGSISDAIAAIDFAIKAKAYFAPTKAANVRVLSNSWGGPDYVMALQQEIQAANSADMLFVAAAGNAASNNDSVPFYPASMNVPNVISVAATQGGDLLASFSNYGPNTVHLGAPGADVHSTYLNGQYAVLSGTSMATPHVAGAAALVLSGCNQTTAQLKATLLTTVDVVPGLNGKVQTNGRLNVDRALRSCATLPVVTLTTPTEGSTFPALPTISLTASASDPDGIKRVEFYQGATLIGSVTTPPFAGTWSNVANGNYTLTAIAFDTFGLRSVSSPVHITVAAGGGGGGPAAATFLGTDMTTQGTWRGVYGTDGSVLANESSSPPGYATVTPTGASVVPWTDATTDVRALQRPVGAGRFAATWYGSTFGFDVNVSDGAPHQLSVYVLDWSWGGRAETIELRDAATNTLLDSRAVSGFVGGQYWRWTIQGHVVVRVLVTTGANAVVSGVFFDTSGVNVAPTVTLTAPTAGAQFIAPATIAVKATATDANGIAKVEFYQTLGQGAPVLIAPAVTTPPYEVTWSNVAAGSYTVTAKAYDTTNLTSTSAVPITVSTGGGGTPGAATFIGSDTTTQGTWRGVYGTDGSVLANESSSPPGYATVTPTGASVVPWTDATTDVRALQRPVGAGRFAATWYGSTFGFDVNVSDGAPHQLSVYVLDWSWGGRAETIELRDAATNTLLDSRAVSGFVGGQYWRWTIQGHVVVRVQVTAGANAVVSGVFLDSSGVNVAPTVTLTAPTAGAQFIAPATIAVKATATDANGITKVEFYQTLGQGAPVLIAPAVTTPPYEVTWSNVAVGTYTVTAKAYDTTNLTSTSSVQITVVAGGGGSPGAATFLGTDTTTQGTWRGVYGTDGAVLANESPSPPGYATVTPTGASVVPWADTTTEVRALQRPTGSGRFAAAWYGTTFGFDVNVSDGAPHQLSLYVLDWSWGGRAETIELRDAATNTLLDSRAVSGFVGGQYWRWTIQGHVVVRVLVTTGANALVSGVFFR